MTNNLEEIEKKIHTLSPNFSKELLDLLYEYIIAKITSECKDLFYSSDSNISNLTNTTIQTKQQLDYNYFMEQVAHSTKFQEFVTNLNLSSLVKK